MKKWMMGLVVVSVSVSAFAEFAVYDGKFSDKLLGKSAKDPNVSVIASLSESAILVVNKDNDTAVLVGWSKAGSFVETNLVVTISDYAVSTTAPEKVKTSIASKDVVSMTIGGNAVLLGTKSSSTKVVAGEQVLASRKIAESLKGSSIDGTPTEESYGNVALKYNLKISSAVNGDNGAAAINAYIASKIKAQPPVIALP